MAKRRRSFGSVRKRTAWWEVRYVGPDGIRRLALDRFSTKASAEDYLRALEIRIKAGGGDWTDPRLAQVSLSVYGRSWIDQRPGLRPRTIEVYRSLFRIYIEPSIGRVELGKIDTPMVREWRANRLAVGSSPLQVAKAYRLLHAIMGTAADEDRIIESNPCRVRRASVEKSPERPALTVDQVFRLASLVPDRWRAFILVKTFASLRWGEITALTRRDVDLERFTIRVNRQFVELRGGAGIQPGPPKSRAGRRIVSLPTSVMAELADHLDRFSGSNEDDLVFPGEHGQPLRRSNFNKSVAWEKCVAEVGAPGLHLHDLRHTGNTLAAATGASLRDLMARMGHDSPAAAIIYQHATRTADAAIAKALERELKGRRERPAKGQSDAT